MSCQPFGVSHLSLTTATILRLPYGVWLTDVLTKLCCLLLLFNLNGMKMNSISEFLPLKVVIQYDFSQAMWVG